MPKTIAVNAGSSTLKFKLFDMPSENVVAEGIVDRVGFDMGSFTLKYGNGQKYSVEQKFATHQEGIDLLLQKLTELKIINDFSEITGVGHRIVAGGEYFTDSVLIDDDVLDKIESLIEYAPLHQPAHIMGIKAFKKALPNATAVAVFDTSFHAGMPEENYLYSIPYE